MRVFTSYIAILVSIFSHFQVFPQYTVTEVAKMEQEIDSIGAARIRHDGTIELHLRAEMKGGAIGDALLLIPPSDPRYADILKHLGGLKPGEDKPVPPWPDHK